MKFPVKHPVLYLILFVGTVIRLWGFWDMDFHHDELSALLRTQYHSFSDLIQYGVIADAHPALTQVFLWIWMSIVGMNPFLVKLPFIAAGIASMFLVYKTGRMLFGHSAALISTTLFAVLQYGVTYAQWARPYSFGILFVLLAFYFLVNFSTYKNRISLVGFALSVALAGYTHYFSLLQIILLSLLWFVFKMSGKERLWLMLASIAAFIFWLPHLPITLIHLSAGGIGEWLQRPQSDFWLVVLTYSFHYEIWAPLLLLGGLISYVAKSSWKEWSLMGSQLVLLGSWVLCYGIAYAYSVMIDPLLHFGTMAFAFPILALFLGSFYTKTRYVFAQTTALILMVVGTYSLSAHRNHFTLNTHTGYGDPFEWSEAQKSPSLPLLVSLRPDALAMLEEHNVIDGGYGVLNEDWKEFLEYSEEMLLVVDAGAEAVLIAQILISYPCIEMIASYHAETAFKLSKDCDENRRMHHEGIIQILSKENVYSKSMKVPVNRNEGPGFLGFGIDYKGDPEATQIVLDYKVNDSTVFWRSVPIDEFSLKGSLSRIATGIDTRDLPLPEQDGVLSAYLWYEGEGQLQVLSNASFTVEVGKDRYRLFQP